MKQLGSEWSRNHLSNDNSHYFNWEHCNESFKWDLRQSAVEWFRILDFYIHFVSMYSTTTASGHCISNHVKCLSVEYHWDECHYTSPRLNSEKNNIEMRKCKVDVRNCGHGKSSSPLVYLIDHSNTSVTSRHTSHGNNYESQAPKSSRTNRRLVEPCTYSFQHLLYNFSF